MENDQYLPQVGFDLASNQNSGLTNQCHNKVKILDFEKDYEEFNLDDFLSLSAILFLL